AIVLAVHRQFGVLAHEDRADGTRLLAVAAEDAPGAVNLVHGCIARARLYGPIVLGGLQVDGVRRARHRAQPARDALLEPVLVAHEDLLAAVFGKHRELLLRVVDGDGLAKHVPQGRGETGDERANHSHCPQFTRPIRSSKSRVPGPTFLSVEQVLLTTLVVKLAVIAALATMLVRYRRFRHILIFERRDWPDRLVFVLALGIPLTAGVASRLLLNYNAADLTLEGTFLAGLVAGPYAGAIVGAMVGLPPLVN